MNCLTIAKKIVTNEMHQPIAVQIDYQDWLKIEQLLVPQYAQQADDFRASAYEKLKLERVWIF